MKAKITNSESSINQNDIIELETKLNIALPENYKKFLMKYNGGILYDYHPFLSSFNSVKYAENNSLLEEAIDIYIVQNKDFSKRYLPIATTHSDNPITICLEEGENYGKIFVFYLDRDDNPEIVANSLEELLGIESIDEL